MGNSKNILLLVGALLVLLGIAGLAIPQFTTQGPKEVAKIGSLDIQAQEDTSHSIPPLVAGGALAIGLVLLGVGVVRRA
jgi:hypothetical protein